jgi:hypothetical protein
VPALKFVTSSEWPSAVARISRGNPRVGIIPKAGVELTPTPALAMTYNDGAAATQEQYEVMAIEIASNPDRLTEIKDRLHRNRLEMPLFDTGGFAAHLENAYAQIYERYQADLSPEDIYVAR